ncbi:uncharacterized protein LOC132549092 [Ylistrum balloti]|uniref:uncharacterized protein LOC132549092 n=1 Tax=Ylistrum balloti TaxID=509963 RepID=UPI002905B8A2|nr:uncharacterized protein LOC132549092 [Ylistrum balloti]
MRPPDPATILYSFVCFSLLHLQRSMASLIPQTYFCGSEICAGLPVKRKSLDQDPDQATFTPTAHITLPLNSSVFIDTLLDTAPCPPIQRVQLLCESWSNKGNKLTCEERTQILSRCVEGLPIGDICAVIRKCPFTCTAFAKVRDLHCPKQSAIPETLPSVSVTKPTIMTSVSYGVNSTNGSDWSSTTSGAGGGVIVDKDDGRLQGEVVIVLIAVCVFGFVFLPLIVYFLLDSDNRTRISRCCGRMWSCCTRGFWSWCKSKICPTHERFNNEDNKKDEVVEEIVAISALNAVEASPGSKNPAGSYTNDSGIGFDLDFPEADEQTPDEYRNTPWIQRRSLLVENDFEFDWSHL